MLSNILNHASTTRNGFGNYFRLDDRKTVAVITDMAGNELARGEARWRPEDTYCRAVGETLAVGRALTELSKSYLFWAAVVDKVNSFEVLES